MVVNIASLGDAHGIRNAEKRSGVEKRFGKKVHGARKLDKVL